MGKHGESLRSTGLEWNPHVLGPVVYFPICEMDETIPVLWAFSKDNPDGPIIQYVLSS